MKQKVNDWLLRLVHIDSCGNREISYVCLYDVSKAQAMEVAENYGKRFAIVRVFKFEIAI